MNELVHIQEEEVNPRKVGTIQVASSLIQGVWGRVRKIQLSHKEDPREILDPILNPNTEDQRGLLVATFIKEVVGNAVIIAEDYHKIINTLKLYHYFEVLFYLEKLGNNSRNEGRNIEDFMIKDMNTQDQARIISDVIYSVIIRLQSSQLPQR